MIKLDLSHTEAQPNGLLFDPDSGVLFTPRARIKRDKDQPRKNFDPEKLAALRADIDEWRKAKRGPCQSGFLEPLKGRWEPGTLGPDGNPTAKSKIILWDGERRWRVTEDYEWLPVVMDDLSAKEARSAALRTSIHKELLSPVELAHGLSEEKAENKWSNERLGKSYGFGESWARNRLDLLKMDTALQKMVDVDPKAMSHALVLFNAEIPKADLPEYIEAVLNPEEPISVPALKEWIEERKDEDKRQAESRQEPDLETKQRSRTNARTGGGNSSRGKQVTGWTQKDYRDSATAKLDLIEKFAGELEDLKKDVTPSYWEKHIVPQIKALAVSLAAVGK